MEPRLTPAPRRSFDVSCATRWKDFTAGRRWLPKQLTTPVPTIGSARLVVAVLTLTCFLLGGRAAYADIVLELSQRQNTWAAGTGAYGLYLGNDFTWTNSGLTNFAFDDVTMTISESTGDVMIAGTMHRMGGSANTLAWEIASLKLEDIEFKTPDGLYKNDGPPDYLVDGTYDPSPPTNALSAAMFADFIAGKNPFGPEDWSNRSGWGFEWQSLEMILQMVDPFASTAISEYGWTGFAMPMMGHRFVAELHYDPSLGLTFDAWYKNVGAMDSGGYYNVGVTKTIATFSGVTPSGAVIPEPSTYVLALVGALTLIAFRFRRARR